MKIASLKQRILEGSYKKVKGHRADGSKLHVLVESDGGSVEEFEITENEDETLRMESDEKVVDNMTESDVDELLEASAKTKPVVSKKELAQILTINNVKGRNIKESDVDDKVLNSFNDMLSGFAKKHPNFDLFDDEYTGKETDEFVDMLVKASAGSKVNLFEDGDDLIAEALLEEDPAKAIEELKESLSVREARSKRNGGAVRSKLIEALGSPFKIGDLAYKLRKGIPLKENASPSKYKSQIGKMYAETINLIWAWYAGKTDVEKTKKNLLAMSKKYPDGDPFDVFEETVENAFEGKTSPDDPRASNSVFYFFCDPDNLENYVESGDLTTSEANALTRDINEMRRKIQ